MCTMCELTARSGHSAVNSTGNTRIDAMLLGHSFSGNTGTGATVTYAIIRDGSNETTYRSSVDTALDAWSDVANVTFEFDRATLLETIDDIDKGIYFDFGALGSSTLGITYPYFENNPDQIISASIVMNTSVYNSVSDFSAGQEGYSTLLHEIGHALGLAHPDDLTGSGESAFGVSIPSNEQILDATVMISIVPPPEPAGATVHVDGVTRQAATPMLYDIQAIQYLYGANTSHNATDTTYIFAGTNEGRTEWDAGGTDTLNQSSTSSSTTLDLREGLDYVNIIGDQRVWFAFDSSIENAIGGSAADAINGNMLANSLTGNNGNDTVSGNENADTIAGNQGADQLRGNNGADQLRGGNGHDIIAGGKGADTLIGGQGRDDLTGGTGFDRFEFSGSIGDDTIQDFDATKDTLAISSALSPTAADVVANVQTFGSSTFISFDTGSITLLNFLGLSEDNIVIL